MDPARKRRVSVCVPRIAYCTSSKKSYASVTCSITFSSLSLLAALFDNPVGDGLVVPVTAAASVLPQHKPRDAPMAVSLLDLDALRAAAGAGARGSLVLLRQPIRERLLSPPAAVHSDPLWHLILLPDRPRAPLRSHGCLEKFAAR